MSMLGASHIHPMKYLTLCAVLALFVNPALRADDKKPAAKAAPAKAAPAKAVPAKPGAAAGTHGPTAGGHGPTTAGHGPTTTTAGHTTTTTTGRTTTTAGAGAGKGATGTTAGRGGAAGTTAGRGGATGAAAGHGANTGAGRVPNGHTTIQARNGSAVVKRPDGRVASLHDPKRGMDVHHGLNGNRRVVVERRDHSRVFVEHGGHGYVQRPYMYHGHEYARRSYYYHGAYYHNYYGRYYYRGVYINPYYPARYYGPAYYGWVYNPWASPAAYAWGWGGDPWYGYYGGYFTPYPVYASPALWLTDYMISTSLAAAYQAQAESQTQPAALSAPAPLTPEVKQMIAEEVRRQVALENSEAQAGAQSAEPNAASSSIQRSLSDGIAHVFVTGQDLDTVDERGTECSLSQGDALQLNVPNPPDATSANLTVLANKGGRECPKGDKVLVSLQDLQDMQNHMREIVDRGMQELQAKQGTGGLPAAPPSAKAAPVESAMALNAPPPPPENEVAAELKTQAKEADMAEKEAISDIPAPAPVSASTETPTVALGQTPEQVAAALGKPKSIMDLGAKKIYVYPDMKVTFNGGKVTDIK